MLINSWSIVVIDFPQIVYYGVFLGLRKLSSAHMLLMSYNRV